MSHIIVQPTNKLLFLLKTTCKLLLYIIYYKSNKNNSAAGWSSSVARRAHNPKVGGSNPSPATKVIKPFELVQVVFLFVQKHIIIQQ